MMVRRKKYVPAAPLTIREVIRNMIRTTSRTYDGKDHATTLSTLYFLMHGTDKKVVDQEIAKWVDIEGLNDETTIVLPAAFFE